MFSSERPHYSLALFSSFIFTCTTWAKKLFCNQKDPSITSRSYWRVFVLMKIRWMITCIAERKHKCKIYCIAIYFCVPHDEKVTLRHCLHHFCCISIFRRFLPKEIKGQSFSMQISFLLKLCTCVWGCLQNQEQAQNTLGHPRNTLRTLRNTSEEPPSWLDLPRNTLNNKTRKNLKYRKWINKYVLSVTGKRILVRVTNSRYLTTSEDFKKVVRCLYTNTY